MYSKGKPAREIAHIFSHEGIPTPNGYYYKTINKPNPYNKSNADKWCSGTISGIIRNPVYYGAMANGKRQVKSFKNKDIVYKATDEWIIVEDTHIPLITKEMWDAAQKANQTTKKGIVRRSADGEVSLFSGIVRCADCGANMAMKRRQNKKNEAKEMYRCNTYVQKGKGVCSAHTIDYDVLGETVLHDLKGYAVMAVKDEEKFIDSILQANNAFKNKNVSRYEKTIREAKNRIKEIDGILSNLYEDKLSGEVTADIFKRMSQKYSTEQTGLIREVEQLETELAECKSVHKDMSGLVKRVKECISIKNLTRAIVVDLIDRIEISETVNINGEQAMDPISSK